ncbi:MULTISPECIES: PAS domain-containing protein [unclassified Mesorhizobium]|uniref:PAS domain-containing protein n=1 Tax=unclassified Mesorhizobium TaxID=325217 RepID=UPI00067EF019|nr:MULTISPECIES: PAS domain-containing protein [unclassified Mesorhizobium]WJI81959.1 PAS domain-containing protein [Mesorhizobium sp. C374B]WJI88479.1 PAS domain-containing protein [Mesorhizobium sp. C372A]
MMQIDVLLAENNRLQRCLSDLGSVMALPSTWGGREPSLMAGQLLDLVLGMLDLDFAHLHFKDANDNTRRQVTRLSQWARSVATSEDFGAMLGPLTTAEATEWAQRLTVGGSVLTILPVRLGALGEFGLLVTGSRREDFPRETETVLLSVAAAQATIGLQAALQLDEEKRSAHAEQAIAANERNLAQFVNTIPGLAWSARIDGSAEFFNQHYLDYVGLTVDEALGAGWVNAVHPEDLEGLIASWHAMLASRQAGEAEARLKRFDGEYRWFLFRTNPLHDEAGGVVKWFGVNIDIEDRKKAEEALRTGEWNLRQLTETIPQMLWSATPDGSIDYCNARLLDYTGFSVDEIIGGGWIKMLHADDVERARKVWLASIENGTPYQVEVRTFHAADRSYRWVLTDALPLHDDFGQILRWYGSCIDIHDRKEAESAIAASERTLAQIIDTIPVYVWSAGADGSTDFLNSGYLEYLGIGRDQMQDWPWSAVVHPDDRQASAGVWKDLLVSGRAGEVQARFRRFDGEYRWFLFRANPLRDETGAVKWFGVTIDIEELKRAEERLRASEWNLRHLTETIPQMLWSAKPDGAIDYCNTRLLDYAGFTAGKITGDGWKSLVHPDDLAQAARAWSTSVVTGRPYQVEARLIHAADRSFRWCLTTGLPLRDEDGRILKWYGVCVDMHEWKEAQDELRETQAALAYITRVMTMSQLTASIAHELNQPLAGIMTNAGTALRMLTAEPPNIDGARETAKRTIRDAQRASEVISRLRALFTKRITTSEVVDLNAAAQEVVALSSNELHKRNVSLRVNFAQNLPHVIGDRVQLQQVMLNFILNGAEAMDEVMDRPRELFVSTELERTGHVRVSVKDAGGGFDPALVEKLFGPFYTTKSDGMGIGLSVSKTIVENHQGRVWAERNDGLGATFNFSVPSLIAQTSFNSSRNVPSSLAESTGHT